MKEEYLTDEENDLVLAFVQNNKMFEAVRKVLLAGIYDNGTLKPGERANPAKNFTLALAFSKIEASNEELGADLRACVQGITVVQNGFDKMIKMAIPAGVPKEEVNKAR